ncbi:MAG: hydrogenase expression/formation protein [Zoogloeaceae bacterium]|jgi:hydrogenase-1 operon protein HyaF|nr:hydrogenase expression/formation protein [Zoogloeaceae bacterium]
MNETETAPDYLPMPQGMGVFTAPRLPEHAAPALLMKVTQRLRDLLARMAATDFAEAARVTEDLRLWPEAERALVGDALGFGEVSAYVAPMDTPVHWRVQETAFAGLWRILALDAAEVAREDFLQAGAIPPLLNAAMRNASRPDLPLPDFLPGVMNAPALARELLAQSRQHSPDAPAHVINLTLLPVSEADLETLYNWLGHREVSILSRGYGNCRITSTRLPNVWWAQYFNSMNTLILNTLEVTPMPEAALAAREDYADTLTRLAECLDDMTMAA